MQFEEFRQDFKNSTNPETYREFYQEASDDYEELLHDEFEEYDSIIYTENENINGINAHSLILRTRSQYFRKIFFNDSVKKENGKFVFNLPNISSQTFKIILRFIYCGKINLPLTSSVALKLLVAVEELNIESLIPCIQEHCIKHQGEFFQQNEKLFETHDGYDTVIQAGQNENLKELHAHSFILRICSQYFQAKFSNENVKKNGKFILRMPDVSPDLLTIIIRHIYCDKIDLANLQENDVLKFLIVIIQLDIQPLIPYIQKYLIGNQNKFLQHSIEILETVYQHESLTDLRDTYFGRICWAPKLLFNSDKYINISAPLLESILKRDDLILDEIAIWDNLMKWCLAQHPDISQDVKKWNKEDVTMMERTIHKFIPLISFHHISSEDFLSKVHQPFKVLLPDDLINKILKYHITNKELYPSPRRSFLIEKRHFAILASWIDKRNSFHYNAENIPYAFILLYRSSRDGNTPAAFHTKCDNKGATIVIAKIANTDQIVGGYNPLFWDSSNPPKSMSTKDSFIFFSADRKDFYNARVGYCINHTYSMSNNANYGPAFCGLYSSATQYSTWYSSSGTYYSNIDGMPTGKINVFNYEVFQVIKK